MNKYIEYFNTLNSADLHIIDNYPWCGRIEETDLNLFSKEPGKIVVEDGKGKVINFSKIIYTNFNKLPETTEVWTAGLHTNAFNVSIIDHSFSNGTGIITFAGEMTSIGKHAFYSCSSLTSITIPNSVISIGDWAFWGCDSLSSINVDAGNTYYASIDGVLFNYAKDTLIQYPIGNTRTEYTVPNSVTCIGHNAFHDCRYLVSITIPDSVTKAEQQAFNFSRLTKITCKATTPPTCETSCFQDVTKSIPVYVPASSISAYRAAYLWKEFTNFQPIPSE